MNRFQPQIILFEVDQLQEQGFVVMDIGSGHVFARISWRTS